MSPTRILFFVADDLTVPVADWLDGLVPKVRDKLLARLKRLRDLGHELRRPESDYLRDGLHELRVRFGHTNYRIVYFFFENRAVVLAHGLTKEREIPLRDIQIALARRTRVLENPTAHLISRESPA